MTRDRPAREHSAVKRANPGTIQDKVLVGYQGWFTCAGDGEPIGPGHHGWLHWFHNPLPSGGRPNTDLWPDTSAYDASELYLAPGLATASGDPVQLFSSRHPRTVQRHFHWMAMHGVDGAFLQRFAGQCEIKSGNHGIRDLRDEVGDRVREAAEAEGRVFAIMYDVSGVSPDKIQNILEQDWAHLLHDKHILDSPSYLRENNRPVVALWGFGFSGRNHTPALVRAIAEYFHTSIPQGVYLVAGTPGHWRTSTSDADRNPEFVRVWTECFDAISPWTIGRYGNEEDADRWGIERVKADAEYLRKVETEEGRKVDYIPVVFPGGSGFNLSQGKWGMNDIRRDGGRFLWRQLCNAQRAGVRTIYGAMWDEYDEGTAFLPVVSRSSQLPVHPSFRFIALDVDGYVDLPSDWYMRIAGFAADAMRGERVLQDAFPEQELREYWNARSGRGEKTGLGVGVGVDENADVDGVTRAFREWGVSQGGNGDGDEEAPPPPYSLEDTAAQGGSSVGRYPSRHQNQQQQQQQGRPGRQSTTSLGGPACPSSTSGVVSAMSTGNSPSRTASPGLKKQHHSPTSPPPFPPPVNLASRPTSSLSEKSKLAQTVLGPPIPQRPRPDVSGVVAGAVGAGVGAAAVQAHRTSPSYASPHPNQRPQPPPRLQSQSHYQHQHQHQMSVPVASSVGPTMMGFPVPVGPSVEHARGRSRSRSRSRTRFKSRSRSRSKSRSHKRKGKHRRSSSSSSRSSKSSRSPRVGGPLFHSNSGHQQHFQHLHGHGHGHSHSHSHSPGHAHGHTQSLSPVGSSPAMVFPGAGVGLHHAISDGAAHHSTHGGYAPVHSHPIQQGHGEHGGGYGHEQQQHGYGHGHDQGYGYGQPAGYRYPDQGPPPGHGYGNEYGGYGQGYGHGVGSGASMYPQQAQGFGYAPHPSSSCSAASSSGYYTSYAPGTGPGIAGPYANGPMAGGGVGGNGVGGGPLQGGIASALQAVEGIAGVERRKQLERTVNTLFNKLK